MEFVVLLLETKITFGKIRWKKQKVVIIASSRNSLERSHRRHFGTCDMMLRVSKETLTYVLRESEFDT